MPGLEFKSLVETEKWAKDLAKNFTRPCLVLLDGEMGSGKTQLVRWFVEALGGTPASSPTFAIHQTYQSTGGDIEHVDLYRLESTAGLESTGFWDLLKTKSILLFVEWADRLPNPMWPNNIKLIRIELHKQSGDSEARRIEWSGV